MHMGKHVLFMGKQGNATSDSLTGDNQANLFAHKFSFVLYNVYKNWKSLMIYEMHIINIQILVPLILILTAYIPIHCTILLVINCSVG
jgi:hypothetical protein